jgi:hypothetical protein
MGRLLRLALFAVVVFIVLLVLIAMFTRGLAAASPLDGRPGAPKAEERAGVTPVARVAVPGGWEVTLPYVGPEAVREAGM